MTEKIYIKDKGQVFLLYKGLLKVGKEKPYLGKMGKSYKQVVHPEKQK